jgi:CheY-like chemotaxis protein
LTPIIGYTELVLYDAEKGTLLENNLQEIYIAAKRAKDLVKQILVFARQSEEDLKPVQVDLIAKEAMKLLRSSIPTSVEIQQHIKSNALIMGNPTQVHQIFMNLCTNAANAMEDDGGIMEVRLTDVKLDTEFNKPHSNIEPGNYIQLSVSDTGTGIPPDVIESIFEPYFTTKASGKGTGMGLATVHGIVKSYGGEIWAESELGKGAVFTIYLPITKKRTEDKLYQPEVLPTGVERILFVDDELPIVNMNSQVLDRLGYQVTAQTSSIKALELFCSKPNDFDLVITDMTMPNMTGDKLAFELMKIRPDIPVILCTGYSKRISDTLAAEIGIKAFAYKPVVTADLAKMIRTVLDEAKETGSKFE